VARSLPAGVAVREELVAERGMGASTVIELEVSPDAGFGRTASCCPSTPPGPRQENLRDVWRRFVVISSGRSARAGEAVTQAGAICLSWPSRRLRRLSAAAGNWTRGPPWV